jgi:hypothetical protein
MVQVKTLAVIAFNIFFNTRRDAFVQAVCAGAKAKSTIDAPFKIWV